VNWELDGSLTPVARQIPNSRSPRLKIARSRAALPLGAWLGRSATSSVPLCTPLRNRVVSFRQHPNRSGCSSGSERQGPASYEKGVTIAGQWSEADASKCGIGIPMSPTAPLTTAREERLAALRWDVKPKVAPTSQHWAGGRKPVGILMGGAGPRKKRSQCAAAPVGERGLRPAFGAIRESRSRLGAAGI
jgi:hypothetical protein